MLYLFRLADILSFLPLVFAGRKSHVWPIHGGKFWRCSRTV